MLFLGLGWSVRAAASPGEGMQWLQEAIGGVRGLGLAWHHLPSHITATWGHLCHPTTFHPDQRSRTSGSMGLCDFRNGPHGPAMGKPMEAVCFCVTAKHSGPCWGVIFEGVTWHSSGASAETPGSIPCPVLGWEVIAGCCLSPVSRAVAFLQTILELCLCPKFNQ